jgi:predicted RNA-binding Zn-ribbon protein involved in translation (DUF1610 family)
MSSVEIRCPRCGSPSILKSGTKNDYECSHCNSSFRFIDPTQKTVLRETISHYCPSCGGPAKSGETYVCAQCGKEWLCERCVRRLEGKYSCVDCLKDKYIISGWDKACPKCRRELAYIDRYKRWYCYTCSNYVTNVCPDCGAVMDFVPQYGDFWCNMCKAYPRYKPRFSR